MNKPTFDQLPNAVSQLNQKLEKIERLLSESQHQPEKTSNDLLTIEQAAEFLHLSKATLYSKVSRQELPVMKRGKRLYFSRKELMDYLKEGRKGTVKEAREEAHKHLR